MALKGREFGSDFFPVPLATMQSGTMAPVDLYIRSTKPGPVTLYRSADTPVRDEVRERLLANGVSTLWLRAEDRDAFGAYIERNLAAIVSDDQMPVEDVSQVVYACSVRVMKDVFDNPRSGDSMLRIQAVVEGAVLALLKDLDALWHITSMASHDYYTYTHCISMCMFLLGACRDVLGITDRAQLVRIGLGGMLHDVGKSQVPKAILLKPGKLTQREFEKIKAHPLLGLRTVRQFNTVSLVTASIIRSHHERLDGSGYPDGLGANDLSQVVRLAAIADVYDALTTDRCYAPARKPAEALKMMLTQTGLQFDQPMLREFVRFLGPGGDREELLPDLRLVSAGAGVPALRAAEACPGGG